MDQPIIIGDRVNFWRLRRNKSQRAIAARAGISQAYLSQIESGLRPVEKRATLVALAEALGVSVAELSGRPGDPTDPVRSKAAVNIPAIRQALIMRQAGEVRPVPAGADVDGAVSATTSADYAVAAAVLPDLLGSVVGADMVKIGYGAMSCLVHIGYPDLAREAAALALNAAQEMDDPAWLAVARWVRARALPPETAPLAVTLARQAAVEVQPHIGDPAARQAYGMLHLISALRSAIAGQPQDAMDHIGHAEQEAVSLGDPEGVGLCHLGFGPTNVAIWRMAVLAEIGDIEQAAAAAGLVEPGRLRIPHRQAMFWIDHGRTLAALKRDDDATVAFLRAERVCPQLVRLLPTVQSTIGVIWRRKRRAAVSSELRHVAEMVGIRDR